MGVNWSKSLPKLTFIPGISLPHKFAFVFKFLDKYRVFVVNTSLKMGAGKMAAQVGHAAVGLYRNCRMSGEQGQMALDQWSENGEMKIVLKGESSSHLDELNKKANNAGDVFVYLVCDAGHTQIPAGSKTVLGVFGTIESVDRITGGLRLF